MRLPKGIKIRWARFRDASDIFAIGEKNFDKYGMEDWTFTAVAEFLEEHPRFCLVSVMEKKIAGFLLARPYENSRTRFYVNWVSVRPEMQGKGIGAAMIERVIKIAKSEKYTTIIIDTQRHNIAMQSILEQKGFQPIEEEIFYQKKLVTKK